MVIVKATPGLGNQMAQFAFYLKQRTVHKDVKIDNITEFHRFTKRYHNGYELEKIFGVKGNYASFKDIKRLSKFRNVRLMIIVQRFLWAFRIKSIDNKNNSYNSKQSVTSEARVTVNKTPLSFFISCVKRIFINHNARYFLEDTSMFYENYLENSDIYFNGYWLNIDYYIDIMDSVNEAFTFRNDLDNKNKEMLKNINSCCSVSIHIRRGDYVGPIYENLTFKYYENAIKLMESKLHGDLSYFIFSDDIKWVKDNFSFPENRKCYFIDWNKGENSYIDMQLMSNCKHNIIANSSFSWWASLLNRFDEKIIITPKNYYTKEHKAKTGIKDDNLLKYPKDVTHFKVEN